MKTKSAAIGTLLCAAIAVLSLGSWLRGREEPRAPRSAGEYGAAAQAPGAARPGTILEASWREWGEENDDSSDHGTIQDLSEDPGREIPAEARKRILESFHGLDISIPEARNREINR